MIQPHRAPDQALIGAFVSDLSAEAMKVARVRAGARLRTLDLFAGCGGMSLGFKKYGFDVVGAIENDPIAFDSHRHNFSLQMGRALDINECGPIEASNIFGIRNLSLDVDVIIGGPPCQAFARVGRSKLREIAEHPEAFLHDERASLYLQFLKYVDAFRPIAVVFENVPDLINYGGTNVAQEIAFALELRGFDVQYTLLNSAHYGVPQMRERVFLVACHRTVGKKFVWPTPTHKCDLPVGYEGSRQVALKKVNEEPQSAPHFQSTPSVARDLPNAVTVREAIADLPPLFQHLNGCSKRGARRFTELSLYAKEVIPSLYARSMRDWHGYESKIGVIDHVIRHLPRDFRLFQIMAQGDQYPELHKKASAYFSEVASRAGFSESSSSYQKLKNAMVPPYDPDKFPNKWRKMEADSPSRTLMAHLGKDGYSHIHYDSDQGRTISVREAARLQSFPDGFIFSGTMNPAFRQIGNAVPPLLAASIAAKLSAVLTGVSGEALST